MSQVTVNDAVSQALAEEMRRDPRVLMMGEGVATKRQDLVREFGAERVRNAPLAEAIIAAQEREIAEMQAWQPAPPVTTPPAAPAATTTPASPEAAAN